MLTNLGVGRFESRALLLKGIFSALYTGLSILSWPWGASTVESVVENKDTHSPALHAQQTVLENVPSLGKLWVFCLFPTE